jgi:hypothetical protein
VSGDGIEEFAVAAYDSVVKQGAEAAPLITVQSPVIGEPPSKTGFIINVIFAGPVRLPVKEYTINVVLADPFVGAALDNVKAPVNICS